MPRVRGKLTYSNVISTLCLLLVVGGGTAYAAVELGKESVSTRQLAKGAVTPAKLSKSSKKAMKGARGATGPAGPQGPKGDQGLKGDPGQPGPFPSTLPSGKTLKGDWAISHSTGLVDETAISFGFPLAQPLQASNVHFIDDGAATPAGCSGDAAHPGADPGNLCVFVGNAVNFKFANSCVYEPSVQFLCAGGVGPAYGTTGAAIFVFSANGNLETNVEGTWAVTGT